MEPYELKAFFTRIIINIIVIITITFNFFDTFHLVSQMYSMVVKWSVLDHGLSP